jgi:hypothetical protein
LGLLGGLRQLVQTSKNVVSCDPSIIFQCQDCLDFRQLSISTLARSSANVAWREIQNMLISFGILTNDSDLKNEILDKINEQSRFPDASLNCYSLRLVCAAEAILWSICRSAELHVFILLRTSFLPAITMRVLISVFVQRNSTRSQVLIRIGCELGLWGKWNNSPLSSYIRLEFVLGIVGLVKKVEWQSKKNIGPPRTPSEMQKN